MSNPIGDRNVLAGIIAVQKKYVTREALVAALQAWTRAKEKGLAQILREQKTLTENQHALLEEAVYGALSKHGNDAKQALAALESVEPIKKALANIADTDLQASVAHVGTAPPEPEPIVIEPLPEPKKKPTTPKSVKPAPKKVAAPPKKSAGASLAIWLGIGAVAGTGLLLLLVAFVILLFGVLRDRPVAEHRPVVEAPVPVKDKVDDKQLPVDPPKPPLDPAPIVGDRKPSQIVGEAKWRVEGEELVVDNPSVKRAYLCFGSKDWVDYDFTFDTNSSFRNSGGMSLVRAADADNNYRLNLGVFQLSKHTLIRFEKGMTSYDVPHHETPYKLNQWYAVRMEVRGDRIRCFVDGKEIFDYKNRVHAKGQVGFGAAPDGKTRWKNIAVLSLDGDVLWSGPPELGDTGPAPPVSDGFVSLFNGKDLTGWRPRKIFQKGNWRVENGILLCDDPPGTHYLQTEKPQAKDFHLRLEVRLSKPGNGGVYFRCPVPDGLGGYYVTITKAGPATDQIKIGGLNCSVPGRTSSVAGTNHLIAPNQWFTLEVIAQANHLIVKVNGQTTADVIDANIDSPGDIAFRQSGGTKFEIRKIEIKDLKGAAAVPVAVDKSFVPLFNGKNLDGWRKHANFPGDWRVENGLLIGSAGPRNLGRLESEVIQPKDFHLRVEARLTKANALGNVFFRSPEGTRAGYESSFGNWVGGLMVQNPGGGTRTFPRRPEIPVFQPQPGEWFTLEVIAEDNRFITKVDGVERTNIVDATLLAAGRLGLTAHTQSEIEFRKIEIKPLGGAVFVAPPPPPTPGFTALFNGKDLTGWKPDRQQPGKWSIENGTIVGTGGLGNMGMLYTDKPVSQDFHLRFEAKVADNSSGYIRFRCADGSIVGYEVTINSNLASLPRTGNLRVVVPGRTTDMVSVRQTPVLAEQWALIEVIAQGRILTVMVNGNIAARIGDGNHLLPAPGHIVLGSANGTIAYRKVEVKELQAVVIAPPPPPPPVEARDAPPFAVDPAFKSMFNGKDLTGWKTTNVPAQDWKVVNGILTSDGRQVKSLYTPRDDYGDFHLRAEMRISTDGHGSLAFRYPHGSADLDKLRVGGYSIKLTGKANDFGFTGGFMVFEKVGVRNFMFKEPLAQPGHWVNLEIITDGNLVTTKINGKQAIQFLNPKTHLTGGRFVIRGDTQQPTVLEFRKIEIKELKAVPAPPAPPPEGPLGEYVPLFNGKDLAAWRVEGNDGFKVLPNGELVGQGPNTALITKKEDYRSFIAKVRLSVSADADAFFAFRQTSEEGKLKGMTSRITGDGKSIALGMSGLNGMKGESGDPRVRFQPGEWIDMEFHVRHDNIRITANGKPTGGNNYNPEGRPPGAIGLHIVKGTVRIEKFEISAENVGGAPVVNPPEAADFAQLFNGKDLTGWKSNRVLPAWRVVNGVLTGSGAMRELYTERDNFGDFHLRLQARVNTDGHSAVLFRYPFGPADLARTTFGGYATVITGRELDALKTGTLTVFEGNGGRNVSIRNQVIPANEWFAMDIIAVGSQITVRVNGVGRTYRNPKDELLGGRIVLGFGDTNRKTVIEYRKIEIKEFKQVAAPPPPATIALRDWTPLFNGKDLTGLRADGEGWQVTPNGLVGTGPNSALLTERKDYKNFNVKFRVTVEPDTEAYFGLRQHPGPEGKWLGLTSRITANGVEVKAGRAGADATKFEIGERQLNAKAGGPITLEFQVHNGTMKVLASGIGAVTATLAFPPDKHPPGAIGMFVAKGTVRIEKFEVAEEAPVEQLFMAVANFEPLFNTKNLDGWEAHADVKGTWRVDNGILTSDGAKSGILQTRRADYKDYHLRMEARFTAGPDDPGGHILVRSPNGLTGCETRFAKGKLTGGLYLSGEEFGKPFTPKVAVNVPSGEWCKLEIIAQGNQVVVMVNGKQTCDFIDEANLLKTGRIALHHGENCKIEVRKIELQELKAVAVVAAPPPMPNPAKGNFAALFNGKDLTGWQAHAKRPGDWRVENGVLIGSAPIGGALYSTRADYQDFHLRAEVRINDKGFGRIFGRAAYEPTKIPFKVLGYEVLINQRPLGEKTGTLTARSAMHTAPTEPMDPPMPNGDWLLVEVIAKGELVLVKVNGNPVAEHRDEKRQFARTGHIALQQDANATIEFRRVEIEDLTAKGPAPR